MTDKDFKKGDLARRIIDAIELLKSVAESNGLLTEKPERLPKSGEVWKGVSSNIPYLFLEDYQHEEDDKLFDLESLLSTVVFWRDDVSITKSYVFVADSLPEYYAESRNDDKVYVCLSLFDSPNDCYSEIADIKAFNLLEAANDYKKSIKSKGYDHTEVVKLKLE